MRALLGAAAAVALFATTQSANGAPPAPLPPPMAEAVPPLRYLDPDKFAPQLLLPPPPQPGSAELARELAQVRVLGLQATPARYRQAEADGASEEPLQFDLAAGRKLEQLPATYQLLKLIRDETEAVVVPAKQYFALPRPYQIDPKLRHCGKGTAALTAYPSGHAGFGYSVGWALARLLPARAPQILARASDYALSREICGVHFHSDTEASRVIGTVVAERLLADPRLADQVAAARRELAQN